MRFVRANIPFYLCYDVDSSIVLLIVLIVVCFVCIQAPAKPRLNTLFTPPTDIMYTGEMCNISIHNGLHRISCIHVQPCHLSYHHVVMYHVM